MANRIQIRRDTSSNWVSVNPILAQGELGYELNTGRLKVGNGMSVWTNLPYFNDGEDFSGNYADLEGAPTSLSDFINDQGFITAADIPEPVDLTDYALRSELPDVSNFITLEDIPEVTVPTALSELTNDVEFITAAAIPSIPTDISDLTDTEGLLGQGGSGFSGDYNDLSNRPELFNGDYNNLTNTPAIPTDISDLTDTEGLLGQSGGTNPVLPYVRLTNDPFIFNPYVGEQVSFTKEDYATGDEATDYIDNEIAITRGEEQGIYNPLKELEWDDTNDDGVSPVGTLWNADGWDDLTNVADRRYFSFYEVNRGSIGSNVRNVEFVMQDVANNRYYKFYFTVWTPGWQGAAVTYTRQEIDPVTGEDIGELVTFVKAPYSDPTEVNDPIDTNLTIARGSNQGIYNIALETGWSTQGDGENSPAGTLWNADGWGKLDDVVQRTYVTFLEALNYAIGNNIIGTELVMWDTINNKYWAFKFSSWTRGGNGGGFSYTRQQINTSQLFVKSNYGDEVDEISEGLHITRGDYGWLYNPLEESSHDDDTPTGSLWNNDGWDDFGNVESRTYVPLEAIWGGNFASIPGARMVMLDTTTGKYWAIQFLSWTAGNGGGFSYLRYELDLDQLNEGVKFADGSVLKSARGLDRVKSKASGGRRIEEVVGSKTITVTPLTSTIYTFTFFDNRVNNQILTPRTPETEAIIFPLYNGQIPYSRLEISLDGGSTWADGMLSGYSMTAFFFYFNDFRTVEQTSGETFLIRVSTGGEPQVWWDKNDLPGGSRNFRGAIIDYHAYVVNSGTIIGTIHIARDNGNEYITHTEVHSGSSNMDQDDLWVVTNEGTVSYRRLDGSERTLKVHWTAKVFYGSEYYD